MRYTACQGAEVAPAPTTTSRCAVGIYPRRPEVRGDHGASSPHLGNPR